MFKKKKIEGKSRFGDGVSSLYSAITNRRNALSNNVVTHKKLSYAELRDLYKEGLPSRIVRLKVGYALNDTIQFKNDNDKNYYNKYLREELKRVCRFMIGFGRGIIVNYYQGDYLDKPLTKDTNRKLKIRSFSGDEVTVLDIDTDFHSNRYNKPKYYMIKGYPVHYTRVVDFTYVEPPMEETSEYNYGGISEFELLYSQILADKIIERASANIIEKNASLFYKLTGFNDALKSGKEEHILNYLSITEDQRSNHGATLIDANDSVEVHSQALSNLKDISDNAIARLGMTSGLGIAFLTGQNSTGLNATGDNERLMFQDTIETVQSEYILDPFQKLCDLHGMEEVCFKENQGDSPQAKVAYEKEVILNALNLAQMGEDYNNYLMEHGIIKESKSLDFFNEDD